ncbi:MAG: hypothetical protein JXQ73_07250 [Phycisphaerae bacterium]|nr:hypothetical protein [Phycisphaerae bacterium]
MTDEQDHDEPQRDWLTEIRATEVILIAVREAGFELTEAPREMPDTLDEPTRQTVVITARNPQTDQTLIAEGQDRYAAAVELVDLVGLDTQDLAERLGLLEPSLLHPRGRTSRKLPWILSFLMVAVLLAVVKGCLQGTGPLAPLFRQ